MTRTKMVDVIHKAQKASFPQVRDRMVEAIRGAMHETEVPERCFHQVETYLAGTEGGRRRVVEETVWALSRLGLLRTAEDAAVIEAAKHWQAIDLNPDATVDDLDEADANLAAAVKALPDFGWEAPRG